MENIGLLIKETRKEKDMTQGELAKQLGINASTLSRWETGDIKNMKRNHVAKLSKILGISVEELMDWDVPTPPRKSLVPEPDPEAWEAAINAVTNEIVINGRKYEKRNRFTRKQNLDIDIMIMISDLTDEQKKEVLDFAAFLRSRNKEE